MGSLNNNKKQKTFPVFLFTCIFVFIADLPLSSHDTQWWPFRADPSSGNLCIQRVLHDNTVTVQGLVCSIIYRRLLCVGTNSDTHTIGDTTLKTGNERHICIYATCCISRCFCVLYDFLCLNLKVKTLNFPCMSVYMYVSMHGSFYLLTVYIANKTRHMASDDLSLSLGPDAFFA